jgi:pimeloyl-ACP methyl ester carboxylesterase
MKQFELKTGRLRVFDQGTGPAIVFVHGFPLDAAMWQAQLDGLSSRFRCIAPSLPGFGGSDPLPAFSIDAAAAVINELIDAMKLSSVALCGLSMGGYIALSFARQFPERLSHLILADTRAEPDDAKGREARNAMIETVRAKGSAAIADAMLPKLFHRSSDAMTAEYRAMMERQPSETIAAALAALRDRPDARLHLNAIRTKTLVIVGEQDVITPVAMSQTIVDGIPNATLKVLPNAGHMANLEAAEAFNDAIKGLIN